MEFKAYKQKTLKYFFISIIFFIILIPTLFYGYLKYELPKIDGKLQLTGLSKNVDIYRDPEGIPHIYAQNELDAYFALGHTMASERLFQMEISRRVANGELAEIIGEKALSSDKMFRTLKLRNSPRENLKNWSRDPMMLAKLKAFYAGVNHYQLNYPLPIEFKILNIKPRPFSELDAYAFIGFMSFNFAIALNQDPLLTKLESRIGPELVDDMRVEKINSKSKPVFGILNRAKEKAFFHSEIPGLISLVESYTGIFEGSNGWLLAKNRTKDNSNMLLNDPHIAYSHPEIWFEAHVQSPDFEIYGHYLPLIPFPILGHNQSKAWGLTMSLTDDMDLYKETIANDQYQFKNSLYPLKKHTEIIKVKGQKDYILQTSETKHGPILDEFYEEKNLALHWSYYDKNNDALSALYQMGQAKNWEEFRNAVAKGVTPGLNVLYADKENIAWWMFGKIELKPNNARTDFILDGSSGKDEPIREMSFSEKPYLLNPASGVIVSANSRPDSFPKNQRGDWQANDRFKTISSVLNHKEKWSVEELKELQTLSMNFDNKELQQVLIKDLGSLSKDRESLAYLKDWDLNSDINSVGATIFFTLFNRIGYNLLASELSATEFETFGKLITSYTFIKRVVLDRQSPWWKKFNRSELIQKSFHETIESLRKRLGNDPALWTWGKVHTLEFNHPLGKIKPLNKLFNLGPYPLAGATQDVNNQKASSFKDVFTVTAGPSTRRIINFNNLDTADGILPVGESGHLLSPYYSNQVNKFINLKYRPMYLKKDLILKNQAHHLELIP